MGLFINIGAGGVTLEFLLPLFLPPPKYSLNLAEELRRLCSSRIELIVEDDHSDLSNRASRGRDVVRGGEH